MISFPDKLFLRFSVTVLLLFAASVFLNSCRNRGSNVKEAGKEKNGSDVVTTIEKDHPGNVTDIEKDSTFLFDGKSLDNWDMTNFGPHGPVYVSDGSIILAMGEGCTGVTYNKAFPVMNYKVTLDAKRIEGVDFFCGMTFPVGKEFCTLIVGGWAGSTVGLSCIDGRDASENETTRIMELNDDQWYNICLVVREESIKAWIDSVQVIDFVKNGKKLSVRSEVELSRPFGLASWYTSAALKNIRVQRIGKE